ncbi:MAG: biotin/lipoyl-containing protein [Pseudodonghicola sp.]|uniref:biotin/lipoyl-containing protein n=1 Tax=Thioclava sp. L04-15 TaxID=1915318 RepID=UPI00099724E0|nr:lipoyl domain-containing protein [Thioclava sp. L04-15]OOY26597.1 biotin attachment protein [Thioclava sp. L04-15]TNE70243.1 MAG: biotin attachment protein [Paracoccaceae bacterium]
MATDVKVPQDLWEDDGMEAVITNWLASDGANVRKGALIAEIMVEKSQFEVTAPADGILTIAKQIDDIVRKGDVIGQIT